MHGEHILVCASVFIDVFCCISVSPSFPANETLPTSHLANPTPQATHPSAVSTLFIAVVSGAVFVLLLLLGFGVAWREGKVQLQVLICRLDNFYDLSVCFLVHYAPSAMVYSLKGKNFLPLGTNSFFVNQTLF